MRLDEFMKMSAPAQAAEPQPAAPGELDFSTTLSPLGIPAAVKAAYAEGAACLDHALTGAHADLCRAIAARERVKEAQVVCGAGRAELLGRLLTAIRPQRTVMPAPGPAVAEKAFAAAGCTVSRCMLWEVHRFAVGEALAAAVNTETDLVYLANPGDPTGQLADPTALAAVLDKCARMGAYLIVDESLLEFTNKPEERSMLRYVPRFPNLVVLKSFSNLYAMPGARLAYCVTANPILLEKLRALAPLPVLTAGACLAGAAALDCKEHRQRNRLLMHAERPKLAAALQAAGLSVYPSDANFLLVRSEKPGFVEALAARGVRVKPCADCTGLSDAYCRIAVRTAAENAQLVEAVKEVLGE